MSELRPLLERGEIAPVYLMYGDEPGLARQNIDALRAAVLDSGMADFNHERFSGRDLDGIGPVLDACAQVPLMAARRLVELADPELVGKARGGAEAEKGNLAALLAYIAAPVSSTVLLLTSTGIDGRSKLVTAVKKVGVVLKLEAIKRDRDAVDFVVEQARQQRLEIRRPTAERLVELVGTHPTGLLAALERASLHAGTARVDLADVEAVAGGTREAIIFDLTDAVGMAQRDRALAVLAELFRESPGGEIAQANAVLAMLIRQLRLVSLAQAVGGQPAQIQAVGGVHPFVARKLADQARGFDPRRLHRAYAGLARLDRDLKGGAASVVRGPKMALQRWILDVCDALPGVAARV